MAHLSSSSVLYEIKQLENQFQSQLHRSFTTGTNNRI